MTTRNITGTVPSIMISTTCNTGHTNSFLFREKLAIHVKRSLSHIDDRQNKQSGQRGRFCMIDRWRLGMAFSIYGAQE